MPPPDVHERAHAGEVVRGRHGRRLGAVVAEHRLAEPRGLLRPAAQVAEDRLAERALGAGLAGAHRVQELAEAVPHHGPAEGADRRAPRPGRVGAQGRAERGQGEPVVAVLGEHPDAGQRAEQAVERRGVRPGGARQLVGRARSVGEVVGDAELGDRVERTREDQRAAIWMSTAWGGGAPGASGVGAGVRSAVGRESAGEESVDTVHLSGAW
jgi:hypothetical protein